MRNPMKLIKVVLVCPCCASPVDAEVLPHGEPGWAAHTTLHCVACGQRWQMSIDTRRIEEHALT